jgi:hypothetical protein
VCARGSGGGIVPCTVDGAVHAGLTDASINTIDPHALEQFPSRRASTATPSPAKQRLAISLSLPLVDRPWPPTSIGQTPLSRVACRIARFAAGRPTGATSVFGTLRNTGDRRGSCLVVAQVHQEHRRATRHAPLVRDAPSCVGWLVGGFG